MSFKSQLSAAQNTQLAFRPGQTYLVATSTYTLFTVVDGAVEIITFGARITGAVSGATTLAATFNGVAGDAGAVAINGAVGTVVYYPVNVGGTTINAAAIPKTVATLTSMIVGTSAGGTIVGTFGVGTSVTAEFFCVYRKLSPLAKVV